MNNENYKLEYIILIIKPNTALNKYAIKQTIVGYYRIPTTSVLEIKMLNIPRIFTCKMFSYVVHICNTL